jgi:hypothetical protein
METQGLSREHLPFGKYLFSEHPTAESNRGKLNVVRSVEASRHVEWALF